MVDSGVGSKCPTVQELQQTGAGDLVTDLGSSWALGLRSSWGTNSCPDSPALMQRSEKNKSSPLVPSSLGFVVSLWPTCGVEAVSGGRKCLFDKTAPNYKHSEVAAVWTQQFLVCQTTLISKVWNKTVPSAPPVAAWFCRRTLHKSEYVSFSFLNSPELKILCKAVGGQIRVN